MSRKTFVRKLKPDLRWQPSRSSSSRRSNLGLKHHWSIWGTTEPTTIQLKHYRTLYAKKESVMRLTRQLLSIKWTGWRPQPGHQRQGSLHFSDANLTPSSGFILHDTNYAVLVYNNLLHSALGKISKRTLSWNWSCWLQSSGRTNQNCSCSKNCEVLAWEEEPWLSSFLEPTPARLEDSCDARQGPREIRPNADLHNVRLLQLQKLELAATVANTLKTRVRLWEQERCFR